MGLGNVGMVVLLLCLGVGSQILVVVLGGDIGNTGTVYRSK